MNQIIDRLCLGCLSKYITYYSIHIEYTRIQIHIQGFKIIIIISSQRDQNT